MGKIADALKKSREGETAGPGPSVPPSSSESGDAGPDRRLDEVGPAAVIDAEALAGSSRSVAAQAGLQTSSGQSALHQGPVSSRLVVFHEPDSLAAEHFKVLRSQILYPRDGKEHRVILVTSAMEQEGKTLVACNLAVSIAQGVDPYALLIDGDLRRPTVDKVLGLETYGGLSDYLGGDGSVARYLIKTPITKLTVLPSGKPPENPAELLTSGRMGELLKELKERYPDRFIVLDSPPVNLAAETMSLAQNADAVVFVVRYGHSNQDLVEEAIKKVGREKILGIVFNGFEVPPRKYSSYYYSKRYRKPY
jgi:protein-tyrosine kinase